MLPRSAPWLSGLAVSQRTEWPKSIPVFICISVLRNLTESRPFSIWHVREIRGESPRSVALQRMPRLRSTKTAGHDPNEVSDRLSCSGDWWTWSGSNRRPLPCHGSALPAAPQAHIWKECNSILTHAFALVKPCERHLLAEFFPSFGGIRATVRNTGMAASCAATENPTSAGTETS